MANLEQERINFIKGSFKINDKYLLQNYVVMLKHIDFEFLTDFAIYVYENKKEFETMEQTVARCVKEFNVRLRLNQLSSGMFRFEVLEEMIAFLKNNFKNKDITNGVGYSEYVIIAMDKDGYLIDRYAMTSYGKPKQLDCDEETRFYKELFKKQYKIGQVRRISYQEVQEKIELQKKELEKERRKIEYQKKELEKQKDKQFSDELLSKYFKKIANKKRISNAS